MLQDAPKGLLAPARPSSSRPCPAIWTNSRGLITENEIVLSRTRDVGIISAERAIAGSLTGPVLRASGVEWDLRKAEPHEIYDRVEVRRSDRGCRGHVRPVPGQGPGDAGERSYRQAVR